ncbi:MAG: hypothetical protein WBE03_00470, partial [Terracidiphilus sp.]
KWFESKGGFAHVMAAVFASLMLAYAAVPQFHALVLQIHALLPGWVQEVATTALALYAWYRTTASIRTTTQTTTVESKTTIDPAPEGMK